MEATVAFKEIKEVILSQLRRARSSIKLAVAWLTDEDIVRVLCQCQEGGIAVDIIMSDSVENFKKNKKFGDLLRFGGGISVASIPFMHHKFCIIDDSTILNGSYNWSYPAQRNNENLMSLVLDPQNRQDRLLLLNFQAEFSRLVKNGYRIGQIGALDRFMLSCKGANIVQTELEEHEAVLRQEFEDEVTRSINKSREIGIQLYYTPLLERMRSDGGGVYFAKRLIRDEMLTGEMKPGFRKLEEHFPPQIQLSIEYLVALPRFRELFTRDEVAFCSRLMRSYNITY